MFNRIRKLCFTRISTSPGWPMTLILIASPTSDALDLKLRLIVRFDRIVYSLCHIISTKVYVIHRIQTHVTSMERWHDRLWVRTGWSHRLILHIRSAVTECHVLVDILLQAVFNLPCILCWLCNASILSNADGSNIHMAYRSGDVHSCPFMYMTS